MNAGTYADPVLLAVTDLDLSVLRAHCRDHHASGGQGNRGAGMPRSNRDLAAWHARQHGRHYLGHVHRDPPYVLFPRRGGSTVGQIPRPLGWYTGLAPVTRAELRAELRTRLAARGRP